MKKLYRAVSFISLSLCCLLYTACTSAFPNDRLDYMWRLDKIEFTDGYDFEGNECDIRSEGNIWYCFARDIVEIRKGKPGTSFFGKATVSENCLTIDFSGYNHDTGYDPEQILKRINGLGLEAACTEYNIDELDGSTLIITGQKSRLYFTRW